ncbi:uncharacterized protein BT62DRAFT_936680 [Guyanagaster necrorhizus]|uniref:Uncharacterized protein n=1 Tax=Guyanagaster necrorhizus TaxID=856835 RepID=A0A9P8AND5_9AGAR|nr:uncharacterized protein BT62DRAFT_936680 [Guyanagaster necrorhizus MCA 3950]KAG7441785.1 hypothetical protein BT62DRAFT_936680 [Guyanagaster necrorhizus MCA 3950]
MTFKRPLRPRQGPASQSGAGQPTSGTTAVAGQVSTTDGTGTVTSDTSAAGSGSGGGQSIAPTSNVIGTTSTSEISTSSTSETSTTTTSTSSTSTITTTSSSSSSVTTSTPSSTFSTTSTTPSTSSTTSTLTSTTSVFSPTTTTSSTAPTTSQTDTTTTLPSVTTTSSDSSTTSLTTIVTSISGQLTTYTTNMPTALATSGSGSGPGNINRTALIAGVTTSAVVLAFLALGVVFIYKRAQKRRIGFMETIKRIKREGKGAGAVGLLDDEFEDTTRYRDQPTTPVSVPRSASHPSLPRSEPSIYSTTSVVRGDSGSLFREEVWPPPREPSGHSREPSIEEDPFRAIMPLPPPGAAQPRRPSPLGGE